MDKIDVQKYASTIPKPETGTTSSQNNDFDNEEIWKIVTENLRLVLDRVEYESWFADTYLEKIQNGVATLSCSNEFKRETILKDYNKFLQSCLTKATGQNLQIDILIKKDKKKKKPVERYKFVGKAEKPVIDLFTQMEGDKRKYIENIQNANLNPRYTFDSFVIGPNNRLAEAVAQSVVSDMDSEVKSYNPVFYYGNSGVGKTHLMQAIGNEVLKQNPNSKVIYVSIEQFLNEMIESIRSKKNEEFRNRYRDVDLLIIDDIQFVEDYPKTQEELFHTFNTLYQTNKQIILASDRAPKEIKNITDRLRTRFEGGMVSDIQPPDYETRFAILKQIMTEKRVDIPDIYLDLISKNIKNSVREIEGALNKVITLAKLGELPSYEDVAKFLQVDIDSKKKKATPEKVVKIVSETFNIPIKELKSPKRTAIVATVRQVAMYLLRTELEMPLLDVAAAVGRKDHTTVMHACDAIEEKMEDDWTLAEKIEICRKEIFY